MLRKISAEQKVHKIGKQQIMTIKSFAGLSNQNSDNDEAGILSFPMAGQKSTMPDTPKSDFQFGKQIYLFKL